MSFPKALSYYTDVAKVLDQALRGGKYHYHLGSKSEATRWRAMAYFYRSLMRERGETRYDSIMLKIHDNMVEIAASVPPMGKLVVEEGVINISSLEPMDNYEAAAIALAKKLQGEAND